MDASTSDTPAKDEGFAESFVAVTRLFSGNIDNPYPLFRQYRENEPVKEGDILTEFGVPSRAEVAGPEHKIFTLFKYADVSAVLKDAKTYTSGFLAKRPGILGQAPTSLDGEEHRFMRNLYSQAFTDRRSIESWQHDVIVRAAEQDVIAPIRMRGYSELISDIAQQFPIRIIYKIIGFPSSREEEDYFANQALWSQAIVPGDSERARMSFARAQKAAAELMEYSLSAVRARRLSGADGVSVIDCLLAARDEQGNSLDDEQIAEFVRTLLPAAGETTTRSFANLMALLLTHPEQLDMARQAPQLAMRAVTEAIRLEGPAGFLARQAATDVEIGGIVIPKGSALSLAVSSANHDDDMFADGDAFDIRRKLKPAIGFGLGPHMCLGMQIAKLEMEAVLKGLLDLPNFRLDANYEPPVIKGLHFRCADAVHVRWG